MRVIVAGGGTGGHIYPALAIAQKIRQEAPDSEILYVGSDNGIETEIVPRYGFEIKTISAKPWRRKDLIDSFKTGLTTMRGISQGKAIVKKFRPDVVIGTGGFICFPVLYGASRLKIPCYIHEQNAFPGVANRALEKFVDNVFLGFSEATPYFRQPQKHIYSGNPVRREFFEIDKKTARKNLGISEDRFLIVSFGGSMGATVLNDACKQLVKLYNGDDQVSWDFITGRRDYDDIVAYFEEEGIELKDNIRLISYVEEMAAQIAGADLIISRAGALSLTENNVCGKPAILIPYPYATGNHQFFNAKAMEDHGAAILIEEKDLTEDNLLANIESLRKDKKRLKEMSNSSLACSPGDATEIIWTIIKKH